MDFDIYKKQLTPGAVVRGWIKFFKTKDGGRGFGFVSVLQEGDASIDVFIRRDRGRRVTGTYGEPDFTDESFDYGSFRFRQGSTEIIMRVEPDGRGGWWARSWGVLPEYTWVDLYLEHGRKYIEPYIGGRMELHSSSSFGVGGFTARVEGLEMTREALTVRARHYPVGWGVGDPEPPDEKLRALFVRDYSLAAVITHDDTHGWLQLELREDDYYSRLLFWPLHKR